MISQMKRDTNSRAPEESYEDIMELIAGFATILVAEEILDGLRLSKSIDERPCEDEISCVVMAARTRSWIFTRYSAIGGNA